MNIENDREQWIAKSKKIENILNQAVKYQYFKNYIMNINTIKEKVDILNKIGVSFYNNNGLIKDYDNILNDIIKAWKNINDDKNNTYKSMEKLNGEWSNFVKNNELTETTCNNYLDKQQALKNQIKNADILKLYIAEKLVGIKDANEFVIYIENKIKREE